MKKITFILLTFFLATFSWQMQGQFSCASGIPISDGFSQTGITTPGTGGAEDWNSPNPANTCTGISGSYWDDDVYLFTYTNNSGVSEDATMQITTRNGWTGLGFFSTCTGTALDDCMGASKNNTSSGATISATATIANGQTVYIAVGQWGTPNDLDFDVDSFTVVPTPTCLEPTALTAANLTISSADLTWTASASSETMWEVVYNIAPYAMPANGMADASGEPGYTHVTPNPALSLSGLNANTTYQVYLRAHCGGADYSNWVGYSFTTNANPPANDDCANAISVPVNPDFSCGQVVSGTILGATDSGVSDNGTGTPNDDVWFSFVATATEHQIKMINKAGTYTDLVHEVLSGDCTNLVSVNVSDPDTSTVSGLTVGDTYFIRVFGWSSTAGRDTTFDVCVGTTPAPPANDDCANATSVPVNPDFACGNVVSGTISGATDSGVSDNGAGTPNDDVWFTFVATATGHQIKMINKAGSYTDLVHEVLSGDCTNLVSVNVSDPDTSNVSGLTVGDTYYIRVFGYSATAGRDTTFDVCVGTPPPPPANDDCANVIDLANETSPLSGYTTSANHDYDQDCLNTTAPDVVYSIDVPAGYTLNMVQLSNDYDSVYRVAYGATCPGDTVITCVDDPEFEPLTWLNDTCADQTVYWVQSGYGTGSGNFELEWMVTPPAVPANDECANPTTLTVYPVGASAGNEVAGDTTSATASAQALTSCDGAGTNLDVFYEFTVPAGETGVVVYFDGCVAADMELAVFDSCGGTEVAGTCQNNGGIHLIEGLIGGTTYLLQVWNDDFNAGSFTIAMESVPPAPANDMCANATALTVGASRTENVVSGTNLSATDSGEVAPSCASYAGGDVWYSAVVPANGHLIVETMPNPSGDGGLAVYSGTCGNLTELACNDDDGDGYFGYIELTGQTPGDTLLIRVWEYNNDAIIGFNVVAYSPACNVPGNPVLDAIDPNNATISWAPGIDGETMWDIEWGPDPLTQGNGTMISGTTDNPYTFTGLNQETTYVFYLRAVCNATDSSDWIGPFSFTTPGPPPANDLAVNAIAVACGDTVTGDTTDATVDPQGDCGSVDNDAPNVFYTFTGTGTAEDVTLSLCNSGYDTSIAVFTGTPGALVCYANNDDSCGTRSEVTFTSDGTQTYYIMIEGWNATSFGAYEMVVSCAPACTPAVANQDCASAMALTLNDTPVTSDNTCATTNINNPSCDQFGTIADVWFSVVVPNSGELNVTTTLGTATDVNVAVYEGACGALTEVAGACADATGTANSLTLTGLNAGDTYYIQAWNAGTGEEGTFDIEVTGTVVSVADLQAVGFTYYPNPVKNSLMMKADETISSVSIFNMLGQEVKRVQPSALETSVDMSNLSSGTYFVKTTVGNAVGTFKVIKN